MELPRNIPSCLHDSFETVGLVGRLRIDDEARSANAHDDRKVEFDDIAFRDNKIEGETTTKRLNKIIHRHANNEKVIKDKPHKGRTHIGDTGIRNSE